jgi:uncharacterized membrane protein
MGQARLAGQAGQARPFLPGPPALAVVLCISAAAVYSALGLASHRALHTNAFDLSVFDYALWSTATGGPLGYVPMFRHSLFAQHFMPTLLLLSPLAALFDSPAYLIVLQSVFHAAAAWLLYRFSRRQTSDGVALALTAAFLFSRRSHSAASSVFYIESAVPLLVFGALLAWESRRLVLYWALVTLALGCKEDVALYLAVFGLVIARDRRDRSLGIATFVVSVVWLALAVGVAIPAWRDLYGLGRANPFVEGRYGTVSEAVTGVASLDSMRRIITVISATGFACLAAPAWAAITLPGIFLNLAAQPGTLQAALLGHYLWPILPWLFAAAAVGAPRLQRAMGTHARWLPAATLVVALIDLPLPRAAARTAWRQPAEAHDVLRQLEMIPPGATVLAQPNLIPHLPRRRDMHSLGVYTAGQPETEYVVLTTVGDLWPFDAVKVNERAAAYAADPRFEHLADGPLVVFRRR